MNCNQQPSSILHHQFSQSIKQAKCGDIFRSKLVDYDYLTMCNTLPSLCYCTERLCIHGAARQSPRPAALATVLQGFTNYSVRVGQPASHIVRASSRSPRLADISPPQVRTPCRIRTQCTMSFYVTGKGVLKDKFQD